MVRQIFNVIIKRNEVTLEAWKKVKVKVIHKKGDVEKVGNYRLICSLPALYKLFTTILYSRSYPRLDQEQAEDQAGFRSSNQTTDHLATYRMIKLKFHEWRIQVWTVTIDFTKALDYYTQFHLESTQILRYQTRLHQPPKEDLQKPESICTDRRREQHVRDCQACFSTQFYRIH